MTSENIRRSIEGAIEYLTAHPHEARYTDSPATAVMDGLEASVTGAAGESLVTDMPTSVGGGDTAPSPGWYFRAAVASCVGSLVAMRAAQQSIEVSKIEVTVDSESDDRGILGIDESVPAGPMSASIRVSVAGEAEAGELEDVVRWAVDHCPVSDAVQRAVPTTVEVDVG